MSFNKEYEPGHGRDTITEFKKSEGQKLKDAEEMGIENEDTDVKNFKSDFEKSC